MTILPAKHYRSLLIGLIIFAGVLRFAIAPITSIEARGDVLLFQFWGQSAQQHGLIHVYTNPIHDPMLGRVALPNYLPPYLYLLWGMGHAYHFLAPEAYVGTPLASTIFKTPSILADVLIILLLAAIVRKRYGDSWALGIGALYAFLPFTLIDGIVWGQIDALNTLFMVACVWALARRRFSWATVFFTVAFFIKLQSVVLLPLLVYEIVRYGRLRDIWQNVLVGTGTGLLLCAPFLLTGHAQEVMSVFTGSAGMYPLPSANAFNIWWLLSGGYWTAQNDQQLLLGIPYIAWGGMLFTIGATFALWFRHRLKTEEGLWLTAAFLAFIFFMLPTEMHERYLFPFFALLLPLVPLLKRARWLFGILSITFTWNLLVVYIILAVERDRRLGNFWGGSYVVSLMNIAVLAWTVWWYVRMAKRRAAV